jgi:cytochrome c biogenesis protein CcmG, thiol:disulfide interchange protein DsbE
MDQDVPARPRVSRRVLVAYAAGLGVCGLALLGGGVYEGFFAGRQVADLGGISGGPLVGQPAPAFTAGDLAGGEIGLASFRGKPLLLNFWATWCVPCRQELPTLQGFASDQRGRLAVLGLDELEGAADVTGFIRSLDVSYPLALDRDGSIAQRFRVQGLPTSFLIDAQGIIRQTHLGALDASTLRSWAAT